MLSSDQTQAADSTATNSWFSDLKQKRDEYNTEIRKKKREDQLKKIRNSNIDIDKKVQVGAFSTLSGSFDTPENSELKRKINEWFKHSYKVDEFLDLILAINSEDRFQQHYGAIGLRKLLSQEEDPPIQYAVENNVIPRLLQFTQFVNEPHLQLEAAWILTNITSGNAEQTKAVVDHEALPYIISLMKSPQIEIVEQGIWTLGNIGGDSKKLKELVINSGGLEAIVHVVENTQNAGLIKHGIWALSNLCRGRKLPTFDIVNKALPIFAHSVKHTTDTAILIDAVWALSYLSDGDSNQINLVLESGVLESLMRLIKNPNPTILAPVIRTLGNIAAGDDEHITILLQMPNIIEYLFNLLSHQKKVIKKEVCWTLSNITAGNEHHIQAVLGNAACLEKILTVTMTENVDTIREALWILTNATHRCSLEQMVKIAQAGVLECFCTLLKGSDEAKILEVVLDGINNILRQGDKIANRTDSENPFMIELEQKQLIPRIEELQRHPSIEVYQAAINLLEKHFDLEDDI